jgi:ABC-type nitrate/sulfonate/bicarbonate transport system substrate-binding protein
MLIGKGSGHMSMGMGMGVKLGSGMASRLRCGLAAIVMALGVGTAAAQPLQQVTIGLASASLTAGTARIAKELGLFEQHGIDAKLLVMDSGNATIAALISRSLKVVVSGTADLITARARGQDVVVITNTYSGLGAGLVISKAAADKSGVSPTAPVNERLKALDGLVIGTASATSVSTISLKRAAESVGANVRFAYLAQPAYAAALESGAIQGHIGGAPFWARPVVKGTGVLWINGAKGEFAAEFAPSISATLGALREVAAAEPDLMRRLNAVFVDLGKAVEQRPNDVKAAMGRLFPDLDATTIDLLFDSESGSWKAPEVTPQEMAHEIAYVKSFGTAPPEIDKIDPASMLFK